MALEEPSISEIIRDIDDRTRRIETGMDKLVTRELYDEHRSAILARLAALESKGRQWWTLFALPAMVGLFLWLIPQAVK